MPFERAWGRTTIDRALSSKMFPQFGHSNRVRLATWRLRPTARTRTRGRIISVSARSGRWVGAVSKVARRRPGRRG